MADFTTNKTTGGSLQASEWNQFADFDNLSITAGITPSTSDLFQFSKATANYVAVGDYYEDSGTADNYVLSLTGSFKAPGATGSSSGYLDGMKIRFRPANNNTGACQANVATLGNKSIKLQDGTTNPAANDLSTSRDVQLRYDLANDCLILADTNTQSKPVFRGVKITSNQSISANTETIVVLNSEEFDNKNWFDISNYKYTPQKAGYYYFHGQTEMGSDVSDVDGITNVIKFNSSINIGIGLTTGRSGAAQNIITNSHAIKYMNGTTDYVELRIFSTNSGTLLANTSTNKSTFLEGFYLGDA